MKPGDKFAVNLNEHVVAEAVVIDIEDGKVTLDIPATRIVMGVKSSLTDLPDTEPEKEYALLTDNSQGIVSTTPQAQNSPGEQVATPNTTEAPKPVEVKPTGIGEDKQSIPADAVGEGLAGVALKEMD